LTATLTADGKLFGNTQQTQYRSASSFTDTKALGDTQSTLCVQLAVMRSVVRSRWLYQYL